MSRWFITCAVYLLASHMHQITKVNPPHPSRLLPHYITTLKSVYLQAAYTRDTTVLIVTQLTLLAYSPATINLVSIRFFCFMLLLDADTKCTLTSLRKHTTVLFSSKRLTFQFILQGIRPIHSWCIFLYPRWAIGLVTRLSDQQSPMRDRPWLPVQLKLGWFHIMGFKTRFRCVSHMQEIWETVSYHHTFYKA